MLQTLFDVADKKHKKLLETLNYTFANYNIIPIFSFNFLFKFSFVNLLYNLKFEICWNKLKILLCFFWIFFCQFIMKFEVSNLLEILFRLVKKW